MHYEILSKWQYCIKCQFSSTKKGGLFNKNVHASMYSLTPTIRFHQYYTLPTAGFSENCTSEEVQFWDQTSAKKPSSNFSFSDFLVFIAREFDFWFLASDFVLFNLHFSYLRLTIEQQNTSATSSECTLLTFISIHLDVQTSRNNVHIKQLYTKMQINRYTSRHRHCWNNFNIWKLDNVF